MRKQPLVLVLFLLIGLVIGGIIGEVFSQTLPLLNYGKTIGTQPFTLDLAVITLTLGFQMSINLAGILGLMIGMFAYSRI